MELKCGICRVQSCRNEPGSERYPSFCPMAADEIEALHRARTRYEGEDTTRLSLVSAQTEAAGYSKWPRVQEIMDTVHQPFLLPTSQAAAVKSSPQSLHSVQGRVVRRQPAYVAVVLLLLRASTAKPRWPDYRIKRAA